MMTDAQTATESNEARRLVRYVDPSNPTGPMLDRLPNPAVKPKPKPKPSTKRASKKKP